MGRRQQWALVPCKVGHNFQLKNSRIIFETTESMKYQFSFLFQGKRVKELEINFNFVKYFREINQSKSKLQQQREGKGKLSQS